MKLIVTHPGGAHKDDFLACCVLAHLHGAPIERRDPTESDLADPEIAVVDVGGSHDESRSNFDHHQFPKDHPPLCALSLVLQSVGIYEDALSFCAWLKPAELLDTRGPIEAAKIMGIPRETFNTLSSPIDITVLRRFASQSRWSAEDAIYQVMVMTGEDLVNYVRGLRTRLNELEQRCQIWNVESDRGTIQTVFLPQNTEEEAEPSFGLEQYVGNRCSDSDIVAMVYPDRRGDGYSLRRYEDSQRVNFSLIEDCDDVRFAHKRGFVAKTTATDPARLKELLATSIV